MVKYADKGRSRYADKARGRIASQCQAACPAQATTLAVYRGRLSWVCDAHARECKDCQQVHGAE